MPNISIMCRKISQRWLTISLGTLALLNLYAIRISLSIAITEITLPPNSTKIFSQETCPNKTDYNETNIKMKKHSNRYKYDWNEEIQGAILSAYSWGFILTNFCAGIIVEKLGCKRTVSLSILCSAVLTLVTPICISWGGATGLIILRVLIGLVEGTLPPSVTYLLAHWIPKDDYSKAAAVVYSSVPIGTMCAMLLSGVIMQHSEIGWPMVFYFYGCVAIISFLLIYAFCYSTPSENPFISDEELNYLRNKLKNTHAERCSIPWRHILTSLPVWTLNLKSAGDLWLVTTIVSDMPKFIKNVLNYSVQDNGLLLSIPQLFLLLGALVFSWIADSLVAKNKMSVTAVRKIGCTLASFCSAIFLIAASYAGCNGLTVVLLQSIGMSFLGCVICCTMTNPVDLSPNFASAVSGLMVGTANVICMLVPYIIGLITPNQTIDEWRIVFWLVLAISLATTVPYLIYGSGDVQKWNNPNFFISDKSANKLDVKDGVDLLPDKEMASQFEFEVA